MKKINQIKRSLVIIAALVTGYGGAWADAPSPSPTETNLLQNGGFEQGIETWQDFGSGAVVEGKDVKEGNQAVYLKKGAGVKCQVVGLKPSTKYRLTAMIKVEKDGDEARLFAEGYNKDEKSGKGSMATAQEWTEVKLEFQTGVTETSAAVGVWKDSALGDGGAFVDDVKLVEVQ